MFWDAVADTYLINAGSPWDEDKAMMSRWGLDGMRSFEQVNVARKEGSALTNGSMPPSADDSGEASQERLM